MIDADSPLDLMRKLRAAAAWGVVAMYLAWVVVIVVAFASVDEWYYSDCTGSCEETVPANYERDLRLWLAGFLVVPGIATIVIVHRLRRRPRVAPGSPPGGATMKPV